MMDYYDEALDRAGELGNPALIELCLDHCHDHDGGKQLRKAIDRAEHAIYADNRWSIIRINGKYYPFDTFKKCVPPRWERGFASHRDCRLLVTGLNADGE